VLMLEQNSKKFIPKGLWIPLPVAAIKYLTKHHRPADRVLYALCLHLGEGLVAVFPNYTTVAKYACVGEKSLRKQYDKLIELGFISIEKKRRGKENQNFYTILPKAWTFRSGPKKGFIGPQLDPNQHWICHSCYEDVLPSSAEFVRGLDWEGKNDDHWKHSTCINRSHSRRVVFATRGVLTDRDDYLLRREIKSRSENIS
jgi:hypothetical protein